MSSTVTVTHEVHGSFVNLPSDSVAAMLTGLYGDVNYSRKALQAFVSEVTECNYFDADSLVISAALVDLGFSVSGMAAFLSDYEDEFVVRTYDRFMGE